VVSKAIKFGEKTQNKGYIRRSRWFKVIEVGINRKPVCNLVITDTLSRTVSELSQLKLWTLRFWATLCGLSGNVRCSSWAHWKARSGLHNQYWTFLPGIMAEALRAKIDWKSAFCQGGEVSQCPPISRRRGCPHQSFLHG